MESQELVQLNPRDEYNRELENNVHPPDWANPTPQERYHLVVIGAGTAGLVTAAGAAGLGAKVALIERSLMGGDCLNVGCVPSKGMISAARVASTVRNASSFGVELPGDPQVNFGAAMERMRRLRAKISPNDSASRFRDLGIDVFFGQGRFVDSSTIEVDGTRLNFKQAVIATGARAAAPPLAGLAEVEYLTNESVFSLTELPRRFGVIGAGPIGCELAQSFAQLGSNVFLVESSHGILPKEDRDAASVVRSAMVRDGVNFLPFGRSVEVRRDGEQIFLNGGASSAAPEQAVDSLLVAVGRAPNVENLELDAVGVSFDEKGVKVNDRLQTTNPRIYAAGDICSPYQFTHAADFMARIVIQNALFMGRKKASDLNISWCTYTSPELAHVGLTERSAKDQNIEVDTYVQQFEDVDRAILEGDDEGFVKVLTGKGTDRILGATVVARNAGDMISELTLAMNHGLGLSKIGSTIHPYPTQAEAIRKLGDQFSRTRLTPRVKSLFKTWLRWTG